MWNRAADLAINPVIASTGLVLPDGALIEPRFADLSAEAIYAALARDGGGGSGQDGTSGLGASPYPDDPGGCGAVLDAPAETGGPAADLALPNRSPRWAPA
ncbi:MAG: hypothetical protein GC191_20060 [Azospirillum sp.]|nr:hypothetical protein [Azospirillum sp.]